jgi:hypothetical protein
MVSISVSNSSTKELASKTALKLFMREGIAADGRSGIHRRLFVFAKNRPIVDSGRN